MRVLLRWGDQAPGPRRNEGFCHLDPVVVMPDSHKWSWRESLPPKVPQYRGRRNVWTGEIEQYPLGRFAVIDVPNVPPEYFAHLCDSVLGHILLRAANDEWRQNMRHLRRYGMVFTSDTHQQLYETGHVVMTLEEFQLCIVDKGTGSARPYFAPGIQVRVPTIKVEYANHYR